ncbi:MAG: DJ-1/PfpI family protein [Planctomycetota bacterium]
MHRVLLWLYPGANYRDVAEAVHAVHAEARLAEIEVVGPKRGAVAVGDGVSIRASGPRTAAGSSGYIGVLVPGGEILEPLGDPEGLRALARVASVPDIAVGAVDNGVVLLGAAGLLRGRRVAHALRAPHATQQQIATLGHYVQGAIDTDEDLVADGPLLTALGSARRELARRFVARIRHLVGPA